ncbi:MULTISPECIES: KilA-N domain-containing protein [Pseudoflavonifractor]|uniref:KilA-N domain-containing protein n=1 Tax=Pseudoflavonifractor TaxID=1017280 RepID=UPI001FA81EAE|nr:KilA-N domain-containing protein [Pseudoflavonifractor sp. An85]
MSQKKKTSLITVQNTPVTIINVDQGDFISLTDMAKARTDAGRAADVIKNWLRSRSTLEFLGTWELLYNPDFKVVEFDHLKSEAGLHTFTLSAKEWIQTTGAIGLYVQSGRYGGTYAHKDIAFEFGSAISPVFKLYLLKEYQRLKDGENDRLKLEWDAKRFLSKSNYLIHTDAVKNYVLPQSSYTKNTEWLAYADEADLLNVVLFGCTAREWRDANPELAKKSNIRDYASIAELTVLSNLETHNAELIKSGMGKAERFEVLRQIAQYQLHVLAEAEKIERLPE